ncbi:MAG TPA: DUF4010 domain-containing protein [Vicinamibacterales bacterium]|nr:DUF4010 domain-containing protein [Vicinamibacterales bacterium]
MTVPSALGIIVAAIGGAAVGTEREWSGRATGPTAHFAGIRTFTLLGLFGGLSGWLWLAGFQWLATVLLAGAAALVVVAYAAAGRRDVDGTTEVAALVVLAAAVAAGAGYLALASAVVAITSLLLIEKSRLHALVARLNDAELRAGFRFAVMAVVILPLLPEGPYGPLGGVQPRQLWALVLFFSGLSFLGYIARRAAGARSGYPLAGLLGGLVSSTSVTYTFARASRTEHEVAAPLAIGVVAACTVMLLRVLVASAVLNLDVARAEVPVFVGPFAVGTAFVLIGLRRVSREAVHVTPPGNPLQLGSALQMALLFQLVLFAVAFVRMRFSTLGLSVSGAVLGLTDMDALTISMAHGATQGVAADVAARAIALGALSNTVLKAMLALALGVPKFRWLVVSGLAAFAGVLIASLVWLR